VPEHVDAAIARALEKLPADRFSSAREFGDALSGRLASTATAGTAAAMTRQSASASPRRVLAPIPLAIALALGAVTGAAGFALLSPAPAPAFPARLSLDLGDSTGYLLVAGSNVAISPDGRRIAYVGGRARSSIYVRSLDNPDPVPVPNTEAAINPTFSPDGNWIIFSGGAAGIRKVPLDGGPVVSVAPGGAPTWGDGDVVLFTRPDTGGIWQVPANGGTPALVAIHDSAPGETGYARPHLLPGSRAALLEIRRGPVDSTQIGAVRVTNGEVIRLGVAGLNPRYVSSGHIVFGRLDGSLAAVPFDAKRLRVTGTALMVLENAVVKTGGAVEAAISTNGTLVYIEGRTGGNSLELLDLKGTARPFAGLPTREYQAPRISPDGRRIAVTIADAATTDVWIYDIASATLSRLTNDGRSIRPEWTPDGRRVVWAFVDSARSELRWQPWDKSSNAEVFVASGDEPHRSPMGASFAAQGTAFAYVTLGLNALSDIGKASLTPPRNPELLPQVATAATETQPRLSPDGRWLAYVSNESGTAEVYVRPFPGPGGQLKISTAGGTGPMWAPTGLTLYYYRTNQLRLTGVALTSSPSLDIIRRDTLVAFSAARAVFNNWPNYDVARDGSGFIVTGGGVQVGRPMIVFNWLDELKERMAAGR
jgi:serine/threonine-protein kinase